MQTTLLGLTIAFIIALVAALIGPYFVDWNQFRPQLETESTRVLGMPVRVSGQLDARLLPTPSLRLRSVAVGGANDLGRVRADRLDVEFSLGALMRGEWRANELTIGGMALDLGLDSRGRIDWPATSGTFSPASLAIDRLNLTGRITLHDAASRRTLELSDIAFSGDVRSLAGSLRGDGNFMAAGTRYPFRISSGQTPDGNGVRVHLAIDSTARAPSSDLDGLLRFAARVPHFEGSVVFAGPAAPKGKDGEAVPAPWRVSAKVKADPSAAHLDQVEASYGAEERALRANGTGDISFGAAPKLRVALSARQLDVDRFFAKGNVKDTDPAKGKEAAEPAPLAPALRTLAAALPSLPMAAQVELSAEQIMLGGRPVQNLAAAAHSDEAGWKLDQLDARAPGGTHVAFSASLAAAADAAFAGVLDMDTSDLDVLVGWLQGRSEIINRSQRSLRFRGNVRAAADRISIEALRAEIDGGTVEGRLALSHPASGASRFETSLKADRLDLDAASAFVRSLAGPVADWPEEAQLSLDIGRAVLSGQELQPFSAKFGYSAKTLSLDQLKFGQANGVALEGSGRLDRSDATGKLALSAGAASLSQLDAWLAPIAPELASRLDAIGPAAGPAHVRLTLDAGRTTGSSDRANLRAVFDLDASQLKGTTTLTMQPDIAALRAIDLAGIGRSEIGMETRLSAERGATLLALLGIDHIIAAGNGPAQLEGSASGTWRGPLRGTLRMWGAGIDADAQGVAEPWADAGKASVNLRVRGVNLAPLLGLKPSDSSAQNVRLVSRVSLAGNRLSFDDLDCVAAGSRLRGRLAVTLGEEKQVDGEVGLDTVDLAPIFSLAIGAAGRDAAEPLGAGVLKGWRGKLVFQALRASLPGGIELRPFGGTLSGDGQSLTLDGAKGGIAGGELTGTVDARPNANGIAVNARFDLAHGDGAALRYRGLKMPAGRASAEVTLATQGRSVSALTGALSGNGIMTLESADIAGLDPRAFDAAIRASDSGQATDDSRLRQIVEPALSGGNLSVASAQQIPFTIRDGRLRVGATTLEATGARVIVSGGYDIPADQVDVRASLTSTEAGSDTSRPEIQILALGSPDGLNRTVDVTSLSSWLAVRAIDRETRRLDSIERGEPQSPQSGSNPPSAAALPATTSAVPAGPPRPESSGDNPPPVRAPYRPQPQPKPLSRAPVELPQPATPSLSEQVAPLPPPIEIRPLPGLLGPKPKPRAPLILMPSATNP